MGEPMRPIQSISNDPLNFLLKLYPGLAASWVCDLEQGP